MVQKSVEPIGGMMASGGHNFNQSAIVALTPDEASQSIIAASNGVKGYSVTTAGTGSIIMTRRYTPNWAIVLAILGIIFALIGLLFLLVKKTETITITLSPSSGGTKVFISGTGSREMQQRLTSVLSGMTSVSSTAPSDGAVAAASGTPTVDRLDQIAKFAELRDAGALTEDEFQAEKNRILNS
jgi:hypothetical protein